MAAEPPVLDYAPGDGRTFGQARDLLWRYVIGWHSLAILGVLNLMVPEFRGDVDATFLWLYGFLGTALLIGAHKVATRTDPPAGRRRRIRMGAILVIAWLATSLSFDRCPHATYVLLKFPHASIALDAKPCRNSRHFRSALGFVFQLRGFWTMEGQYP